MVLRHTWHATVAREQRGTPQLETPASSLRDWAKAVMEIEMEYRKDKDALGVAILGLLAGFMLTLLVIESIAVLMYDYNVTLRFYIEFMFGIGFSLLLWQETRSVEAHLGYHRSTVDERERQYALLVAKFLTHTDRMNEALGRWNHENATPAELIHTSLHESVRIDWKWVDDATIQPPSHQKLIELVEVNPTLKECLLEQVKTAIAMRTDVVVVMGNLFEQVEALWQIKPPQAEVRDVREVVSNLAWRLTEHLGGYIVNHYLNRVSPRALSWLVTNRVPEHNRHVSALEHYVLHGTLDDTDSKSESEPESEPEPPLAA